MIDEKNIGSITGSGGGGGKGKGGGDEPTNTLRSNARARIVDLISEGPIEGLLNGGKSIYYDETPIIGTDGSYNIKGVSFAQRLGTPDQTHFTNVPTVDTPVSVEVQVKNNQPAPIRTISDANADAVRIVMRIPALLKRNKKNGNIEPTSVNYAIDVRPAGGTWTEVINQNIVKQKTSSPYQKAHYVPLPLDGAPWDIRVRRITADSTTTDLQNETWWEAYFILVEGKFIYPNSALVYTEVDAEKFGQQIPQRYYHVKGRKIKVPINYDPIARTYTGMWNGTFKTAWTNNPAWIFYDLLTHDRYGLGEFIDAAKVDKWSLYSIAQYCDQLVPSGYKDENDDDVMEPRFTFNGVINSREEAHTVLQSIINTWRGMAYWSLGQVFATADMPSDPEKLVSPANVIDGQFSYSGTAMKARHSVAIVQWNDPQDFYRPSYEVVINDEMLQRYGWRETEVTLRGCTSRGMAHRYGKWILDVEQHETETVEYSASWDHANIRPGDIIAIADPKKAAVRAGGRIVRVEPNKTNVLLDGEFTPTGIVSYTLMAELPDGSIASKPISKFLHVARDPNSGLENYVSMVGAATGVVGGSGTLPIGWSSTNNAGITRQVVSKGNLSDGRPYVDLKISGTNGGGSSTSQLIYFVSSGYGPYMAQGDTWTFNCGISRIGGSFANFVSGNGYVRLRELNGTAGGSYTSSSALNNANMALGSEKSLVLTRTATDAGTNNLVSYFDMIIPAGATVDITLRFIAPQLEKGAVAHDYVAPALYSMAILSSPFSVAPINGAMWVVTGSDVAPRQYRVLGISEDEPNTFKINALSHDPTKYARVEQDLSLPPPTYYRPPNTIAPPTNLEIDETQYVKDGKTYSRILLSWTPSDDFMAKAYRVSMNTPDGSNIKLGDVSNTSLDIDDIVPGDYTFYVSAVSVSGRVSAAATINYTAAGWSGTTDPFVSDLQIEGQGANTSFGGNSVRFTWKNNLAGSNQADISEEEINGVSPFYRDNIIKIYDTATNTLLRTQYITTDTYTYSYDRNYADNFALGRTPTRSFRIEVAVRDTLGRTSAFVPLSVSNPVPDAPTFSVNATMSALIVNVVKPADQDFAGIKIWSEMITGFNPATTNSVYDGPSTSVTVPAGPGTTYYVRVAAYDSFDKLNLNVAPEQVVITPVVNIDVSPPAVPTGLTLTPSLSRASDGTITTKLVATVDTSPSANFGQFEFEIKASGGEWIAFPSSTARYEWTGLTIAAAYTVRVRAISKHGYPSAWCATVNATIPSHTTAPGAPSGLSASASFQNAFLAWTNPADTDLDHVEIWENTTNTQPNPSTQGSLKIGEVKGTRFTRPLATGVTRWYWVRAVNTSGLAGAFNATSGVSATTGGIGSGDILNAAVTLTKFASGIEPVSIVATLPAASGYTGPKIVLNQADGKLYRYISGAWSAASSAADITGQLSDSQLAAIAAAKLTGTITSTQVADGAISTAKLAAGAVTAAKIAADTITANELAAGAVTATEIAAGAVTTAKLAAGAVTANEIATDTITAAQIAAGAISTSELAAGAVTTAKLAVGGNGNMLYGSDGTVDPSRFLTQGWNPDGITGYGIARAGGGVDWTLPDNSTMSICQPNSQTGSVGCTDFYFSRPNSDGSFSGGNAYFHPIEGGKTYEFSVYVGVHRCNADAFVLFYDVNGAAVSQATSYVSAGEANGGKSLTGYKRLFAKGTAPSNAAKAIVFIRKYHTLAGNSDSWVFFTRPQFKETVPNATEPSAWTPPGVTIIDGSSILTNAITADKISAGAVTADKITAAAVTADKLAASSVTADKIAALAVDASKVVVSGSTTLASWRNGTDATKIEGGAIAANSITANKLKIGARGIYMSGIDFQANTSNSTLSWTSGYIIWIDDYSNWQSSPISAGSVSWGGWATVYWIRGETVLRAANDTNGGWVAPSTNADAVVLAVYEGGALLQVLSGGTIVDGSRITTGSIQATQIAAGAIVTDKIAAGAITANHIAAATITGAKIAANTITAGNIVAATITGTEIAANSITTDKIAIGDFKNLFVDGNFLFMGAYGKTTWYEMSAAISVVDRATLTGTAAAAPSRYVAVVDRPLAAALSAYGSTGGAWMPCKAGDQFYIACDALTSATLVGTNLSRLIIYWLLTDGSTSANVYYFNPTTAWATYGTTYTAPTNAIAARTRIYFDATTTETSTLYMTNFFCCNLIDGGVLIENGTITATKLNVSSLSAISANIGTCTAGIIKSSDNKFTIDLGNKRILITD